MNQLEKIRTTLLLRREFYGSLAQQLRWREDSSLPFVAATDGRTVYFNPDTASRRPLSEQTFIAAHEIMHCVLGHCPLGERYRKRGTGPDAKPFNSMLWNVATDYRINSLLAVDNWIVPSDALIPPRGFLKPDDTAITIYCRLNARPQNQQPQSQQGGKGHGSFDEHLAPAPDAIDEREGTKLMKQAAEASKAAGRLPSFAKQLIDQADKPKHNMRDVLVMELTAHGSSDDYSWRRPNKARLATEPRLVMPGLVSSSAGLVAVVLDVSGSIGLDERRAFAGILADALQTVSFDDLLVLTVDAQVQQAESVDSAGALADFITRITGGGGTDMPAAFAWLDEHGIRPDQCIVYTDGYTPFGEAPGYPVIWCVTTPGITAEHGRTVTVEI